MQQDLALGLLWYAVFIVSLTSHEAAHALAALRFGDPTAHNAGLVTLDPVAHIRRSPFGMVIVPIASFFWGGWMMGGPVLLTTLIGPTPIARRRR